MHSEKFETVKKYFDMGLWDEKKLRNAVLKSWITPEEFKEISGKDYEGA